MLEERKNSYYGGVLIMHQFVLQCFCTSFVYSHFTFYCNTDLQLFFLISLFGLFLSTIMSVCFATSNAVRTGSFLLFVLFSGSLPYIYAMSTKATGHIGDDVPWTYLVRWSVQIGMLTIGILF